MGKLHDILKAGVEELAMAEADRVKRGEIPRLKVVARDAEAMAREAIDLMHGPRRQEVPMRPWITTPVRAGKGRVVVNEEIVLKGDKATAERIREAILDCEAVSCPDLGRKVIRRPSTAALALLDEMGVPYRPFGTAWVDDPEEFEGLDHGAGDTEQVIVLADRHAAAWDRGIEACRAAQVSTTSPEGLELRRREFAALNNKA